MPVYFVATTVPNIYTQRWCYTHIGRGSYCKAALMSRRSRGLLEKPHCWGWKFNRTFWPHGLCHLSHNVTYFWHSPTLFTILHRLDKEQALSMLPTQEQANYIPVMAGLQSGINQPLTVCFPHYCGHTVTPWHVSSYSSVDYYHCKWWFCTINTVCSYVSLQFNDFDSIAAKKQ